MKFLRRLPLFLAVFTLIIISSCQHDVDMFVPDNNNGQILNPAPVQASVTGKVVDENEQPVVAATVRSGTNLTVTDSRGLFRFDNITLDKYASVVIVEFNNYFKGVRTFAATQGSSNYIKIKLVPKTLIGTVDAATGGAVTLPNNSIVTLNPGSIAVKATGLAYTGLINIYAAEIDPTRSDIPETIPGSFQAIDANNFRVLLKSYGMMAVQLEGQSGELLQIASGKTARLRFTIPSSLSGDAPSTIPLWSLDETNGLWKEEGQAAKTAGYYEGDVSHFSFWNCDVGNNSVYLELTLVTANGPLPGTLVKITRTNNGASSYGYTDSTGHVGGLVFSNEPMLLEVLGPCNDAVYSQNIGPFSQATNLGTITVSIPSQYQLAISGSAVDCNAAPVVDGYAMIYSGGLLINIPITNGNFSTTITRCTGIASPVEIIVVDNTSQQQSATFSSTPTSAGNLSTGTLSACGISISEFVNYNINGVDYSFIAPPDSIGQYAQTNGSFFYGSNANQGYVGFQIDYTAVALNSSQLVLNFYSNQVGSGITYTFPTPIYVNITEFGSVGEFIAGNFSGVMMTSAPATYNITCSFRVRRTH